MKCRIKWLDYMSFVGESDSGHSVVMDSSPDFGGRDLGIRPMEMLLLGLGGCASIDFDYPRSESYALTDTDDTYLGREISDAGFDYPPDQSGFHPLQDGVDALAARLLLAARAEKSIDVQYYLIKNDIVGRAFILALLEAADRGVRVRLLLDDMFTKGYDVGMAALYSHPNFDIRIYNPFKRGATGKAGPLALEQPGTRQRQSSRPADVEVLHGVRLHRDAEAS